MNLNIIQLILPMSTQIVDNVINEERNYNNTDNEGNQS